MSAPAAGRSVPTIRILGSDDTTVRKALGGAGLSLTVDEARKVAGLLGRDPTVVEAHIFNTMWSEHCSYKSSKGVLARYLPTDASNVVLGPGEDAGIVRLCEVGGRTYCVVIAHESHNHPSQIVPNEGAATGIGGIVRDVYCMGADVVGVLDALRFGDPLGPNAERTREIVHGVVEGIWQYGNALGVPNLGGDVYFGRDYDENCLVNVIAVGIVAEDEVIRSRAPTEARHSPHDVVLVGKPTDPSGFGGATFASRVLDEEKTVEDKYAVQVPDPFLKRMLTLATAKVLALARERGASVGFKDLGAGGIACATSELGAAAGLGVRVDLSKVIVAEEGMTPEVIACSETQERYCLIVPRSLTRDVLRIYNEDFELPELCHGAAARVIGEVTAEPRFVLEHSGVVVCDASAEAITTGISYDREARARRRQAGPLVVPPDVDVEQALLRVVGSPNVACREHVFRHYDSEVKGNTVVRPGEADAGVIAPVPGSRVGVAVAVGGNPFVGALDPYVGGAAAVAEAVRNVAAVGAVPIALTDCLNFGNPEDPEVFYDFVEAVRGVGDAARGIGLKDSDEPIPVVSGNVSFYNESASGRAIPPSPIVCAVGRLDDAAGVVTCAFKRAGSAVYLVGERRAELGGSVLAREVLGTPGGRPPEVRFEEIGAMVAAVTDLAGEGHSDACHDISDGGLAVAAVEMLLLAEHDHSLGLTLDLSVPGAPVTADVAVPLLFGECGGFVVEVAPDREDAVRRVLDGRGAWFRRIGETTSDARLLIEGLSGGPVSIPRARLEDAWTRGATSAVVGEAAGARGPSSTGEAPR